MTQLQKSIMEMMFMNCYIIAQGGRITVKTHDHIVKKRFSLRTFQQVKPFLKKKRFAGGTIWVLSKKAIIQRRKDSWVKQRLIREWTIKKHNKPCAPCKMPRLFIIR